MAHLPNACYGPIISRRGTSHFFLPVNDLVREALLFYFTYFGSYQFRALSTVEGLETVKSTVIWITDVLLD